MKKGILSLLIASVFILGAANQAMSQHNNKAFLSLIKQYEQSKEKGAWKLVHVHYSNMPVTGQGQDI